MPVDFDELFDNVAKLKVAVVGDIMLDTYWWGHVERISPEAPVPVVSVDKRELRIGGAGNVALNVASLGANAVLISILGKDDDGSQLKNLLKKNKIETSYILSSEKRITTNKIRIISKNQQMLRLDAEHVNDLEKEDEEKIFEQVEKYVSAEKPDVIILEDYNKGVLTLSLIEKIIGLCNQHNIISTVDPKRKNFFSYKNATLFKPNLKEVKESFNILSDDVDVNLLREIHKKLFVKLGHSISLITLSDKGVFYESIEDAKIIPSHLRNVADVSGAGDTVIAVASLIYAATKDIELTAAIANIAGGLVCEEVGTAAINKNKLLKECKILLKN